MLGSLATKIFGSRNDRELKKLQPLVAKVAAFEPQIKAMSDEQLKAQTPKFKERLEAGKLWTTSYLKLLQRSAKRQFAPWACDPLMFRSLAVSSCILAAFLR